MHPSKGVKKNMLKAWDFTKNKFCHRYFIKTIWRKNSEQMRQSTQEWTK